jgi:hypothetical protein
VVREDVWRLQHECYDVEPDVRHFRGSPLRPGHLLELSLPRSQNYMCADIYNATDTNGRTSNGVG